MQPSHDNGIIESCYISRQDFVFAKGILVCPLLPQEVYCIFDTIYSAPQVSVFVLTRPCMLSTFNLILAFMTSVDTVFLVSSIIEYSLVQAFKLSSLEYDKAFVYFLYPTHNVTLVCSIYLHIVMAFERYLAVCHPELVYASQPRHRRSNRSGNNPNHSGQDTKVIRKKVKRLEVRTLSISQKIKKSKRKKNQTLNFSWISYSK